MIDINKHLVNVDGVNNIRDIGGIIVKDNRIIKKKCILRSSSLNDITDNGISTLKNEYKLSHIYDLRSAPEIEELSDRKIDDVKFTHLEVLKANITDDLTKQNVPLNSNKMFVPYTTDIMYQNYIDYGVGINAINCYKKFFDDLAYGNETCVLFHCCSGKDRTGILALLIEYILGASQKDIVEDYLLVNEINKDGIEAYVKQADQITKDPYRLSLVRMGCGTSLELLKQFYNAINKEYGNLDNYILRALEIDDKKKRILIDRYTEII